MSQSGKSTSSLAKYEVFVPSACRLISWACGLWYSSLSLYVLAASTVSTARTGLCVVSVCISSNSECINGPSKSVYSGGAGKVLSVLPSLDMNWKLAWFLSWAKKRQYDWSQACGDSEVSFKRTFAISRVSSFFLDMQISGKGVCRHSTMSKGFFYCQEVCIIPVVSVSTMDCLCRLTSLASYLVALLPLFGRRVHGERASAVLSETWFQ